MYVCEFLKLASLRKLIFGKFFLKIKNKKKTKNWQVLYMCVCVCVCVGVCVFVCGSLKLAG